METESKKDYGKLFALGTAIVVTSLVVVQIFSQFAFANQTLLTGIKPPAEVVGVFVINDILRFNSHENKRVSECYNSEFRNRRCGKKVLVIRNDKQLALIKLINLDKTKEALPRSLSTFLLHPGNSGLCDSTVDTDKALSNFFDTKICRANLNKRKTSLRKEVFRYTTLGSSTLYPTVLISHRTESKTTITVEIPRPAPGEMVDNILITQRISDKTFGIDTSVTMTFILTNQDIIQSN